MDMVITPVATTAITEVIPITARITTVGGPITPAIDIPNITNVITTAIKKQRLK